MDEQFLHYIWKFQKFKKPALVEGELLHVFDPGIYNCNSGSDFEEARIKIGGIEWVGNIEIHVRSSDWLNHGHHRDKAYKSVVLHVVWQNDKHIECDEALLPTLELKNLVDPAFFEKYETHLKSEVVILCHKQIHRASDINFQSMLDNVLVERLFNKSASILETLARTNNDWEETTYISIASSFGFSTNKEVFTKLAVSLPFKIIARHVHRPFSLEALIFGQAGFLVQPVDDYSLRLQSEYLFLKKKYQLNQKIERVNWKFGKMRPANFPTVRISQFSFLLSQKTHLFSNLLQLNSPKEILDTLTISVTGYWDQHYDFGKPRNFNNKLGKQSCHSIAINTLAPLLAAYSIHSGEQSYMDRAIRLLEQIPKEVNSITKQWLAVGKELSNAFDSQALTELYKNYCSKKKCLNCKVGVELLER